MSIGMSLPLVRIISHCLFDGWVIIGRDRKKSGKEYKSYSVGYSNKNKVLVDQFIEDMRDVFGIEPTTFRLRKREVYEVEYKYKNVVNFLLNCIPSFSTRCESNKVKVPEEVFKDTEKIITFLKAFWDDEGKVNYYPPDTRKLRAPCSLNRFLRNDILLLHHELGVNARDDGKYIIITNKESFTKFEQLIGFTDGVLVGKNKVGVSRWFGTSKNKVLNLMLNSYKRK